MKKEGIDAFGKKLSPMIIGRSYTLSTSSPLHHIVFAPFYSAGYFHSSTKRKLTIWIVTMAIAGMVALTKKLSPLNRGIVDAGVVAGLGVGALCVMIGWIRITMRGGRNAIGWDESKLELPEK